MLLEVLFLMDMGKLCINLGMKLMLLLNSLVSLQVFRNITQLLGDDFRKVGSV